MSRRWLLVLLILASATLSFTDDGKAHGPTLIPQTSGTTELLIAVSPVNSHVVWAAGTGGTYVVTTDGGNTWNSAVVPGAESLQFRSVHGVSDKVAYLMSIGNNTTDFRIYKTTDGGKNWTIEFTNQLANAFYDCFGFWTPKRGIAHSDSVNGVFPELRTEDGKTWQSIAGSMPPALPGEASFAASDTCVATEGEENAWVATGAQSISARILVTRDGGDTWNAYDTPLATSPSAGAISVAFRDAWHGIVGGGDLASNSSADAATTDDGGQTWTLTSPPQVQGSIFCLAYVQGKHRDDEAEDDQHLERTVVITAETAPNFDSGSAAWTPDEGRTWYTLANVSGYWAVGFANPHAGWFVGNNGQILKISF